MEKMNEKMGLLKIQPKPFSSARFQRLAIVFQLDSAKKLVFTFLPKQLVSQLVKTGSVLPHVDSLHTTQCTSTCM